MKRLTENLFIEADQYCYALLEKKTVQKGKRAGEEMFDPIGYYPTPERVSEKLCNLGVQKFVDKDWLQCVAFVTEAHENFLKSLKELLNDRKNNK